MSDFAEFEETLWYYLGEDQAEHGPFQSSQMQKWVNSGYFGDRLMIRAKGEHKFMSLFEYTHNMCHGVSPFASNAIMSNMDHIDAIRQNQSTPLHFGGVVPPVMLIPNPPVSTQPPSNAIYQPAFGCASVPPFGQAVILDNGYVNGRPSVQQIPGYLSDANSFSNFERENPSSSSVSETPDSERCMNDDLALPVQSDKCVSTEDAPWLKQNMVDCGTDTANFPSRLSTSYSQTHAISMRSKDVCRLLKELTGLNFYIR